MRLVLGLLVSGFVLTTAAGVSGTLPSGALGVSANVSPNCAIATGTLTFGAYDPVVVNKAAGSDDVGSTTLTFNCSKNSTSVYVTASTGNNGNSGGACTTTRSMKSGSNVLCYELYTDAGFVNVWASSGSSGQATVFNPTFASSSVATATLWGKIPKGQDAAVAANYTDSVTMTINF